MAIQILEKLQNEEHKVTKHYALLIIIKVKGDSHVLSVRHADRQRGTDVHKLFLVKSWYHVRSHVNRAFEF